jgi:hypothetical protein
MENTGDKVKNNEEVDLTQFLRWIGRGFARVGNSIVYTLAVLRNLFFSNKLFFLIIILAGIGLGILYSTTLQKKYYKSTMVLSCAYLNNQIAKSIIEKLNMLAEPTGAGLSKELKVDIETAKNIQKFEFSSFVSEDDVVEMEVLREQLNNLASDKKEIVEKVMKQLMIDNKDAYQISVLVYDPVVIKTLEKALVEYIRTNSYIQTRIKTRKIYLQSRRDKLQRDSDKLDSLKEAVYMNLQNLAKSNRGSNNVILNDETVSNPLDLFKQDLIINTELLLVTQELQIAPDFEVIDGFTAFNKPESANLFKVLVISFVISILAGYLILGIYYLDRALAKYPIGA